MKSENGVRNNIARQRKSCQFWKYEYFNNRGGGDGSGALCSSVLVPYYRKDIESLEAVQRRITKMIQGMRNLPNKDRLNRLNLHSIERRRARSDMIEVYKWVKGINKGSIDRVIEISSQGRTRSNGYKIDKPRFWTDIGRYWFTHILVDYWNRLDRHVVSAESISSLRKQLDESMD